MRGSWPQGFLALSLALQAATVFGNDAASSDIVLVEPVRVAFLEPAPRVLAASMRDAVRRHCAETHASGETVEAPWLCREGSLWYLREVNVLGSRHKTGLVCSSEAVTPNLRYFTPDMFENDAKCAYVSYNTGKRTHTVDPGSEAPPNKSLDRTRDR
jgi:hypothetical protein